jgi:hypothetical protein
MEGIISDNTGDNNNISSNDINKNAFSMVDINNKFCFIYIPFLTYQKIILFIYFYLYFYFYFIRCIKIDIINSQ